MTAVLQAIGLSRRFGGLLAVSDVSLELSIGELHAVIGPNGAGKSTLVNLLAGELAATSGNIRIDGREVTGWSNWRIAQCGLGRSFQRTNLMPELTVLENRALPCLCGVCGAGCAALILRWQWPAMPSHASVSRTSLNKARERSSHGQLRQLEIGVALAMQPRVLLLDEPLAGSGRRKTGIGLKMLRRLTRDHAVLLVEHDMDVVFAVAHRMTVMLDGRVLACGAPGNIRTDPAVAMPISGTAHECPDHRGPRCRCRLRCKPGAARHRPGRECR